MAHNGFGVLTVSLHTSVYKRRRAEQVRANGSTWEGGGELKPSFLYEKKENFPRKLNYRVFEKLHNNYIQVFLKMQFYMIKSAIFSKIFALASLGHMYFFHLMSKFGICEP